VTNDWRLQGQEKYLTGVTLTRKSYLPTGEGNDHDHCEFCSAKFSQDSAIPDALREGYTTSDTYRWVCDQCFINFRERFNWVVVDAKSSKAT
jgi:hypothetical protein